MPISGPKSIVSLKAGLRASGNGFGRDDAPDPDVDLQEIRRT